MQKKRVRVLIATANMPTGLGTARALAGPDVEIFGLCKDFSNNCCKSRYWDKVFFVDDHPEAYLEKLIFLGKQSDKKTVLFVTFDHLVQLVSDNRTELEKYYAFVLPQKSIVDLLLDKTKFHIWATKNGFPVPESYVATNQDELNEVLEKITYPAVIKPRYRDESWNKKPLDKIYKLQRKENIEDIPVDLFKIAPSYIVQRWILGKDSNVHFCLTYFNRQSQEVNSFTGKKLLQWHRYTGNTAIGASTNNREVHQLTINLLTTIKFKGICSLEVKLSDNDNKYYITEPTVGRNDLQSYLAVAGGINLSKIGLYDALKEEPPEFKKRNSSIWIHEISVVRALHDHKKRYGLNYVELIKYLLHVVRKYKKKSFCYFSFKDPVPFIYLFKEYMIALKKNTK